jgi:hypothetical protein
MSIYQTAFDQLKFITGQDSLATVDGLRLLNFALDAYSSIVMECDGRWKFDAFTNTTHPIGYAALVAGQNDYALDATFLAVDGVQVKVNGVWKALTQTDRREHRDVPVDQLYNTPGTPLYYDFDGNSIFLYPAPNVTDTGNLSNTANLSLRVMHTRPVSYITAFSDTIAIPSIHLEYLALNAARQIGFRISDTARTDIRDELVKWEGEEMGGARRAPKRVGGKIRSYYETRDEDRPRVIRPKIDNVFRHNATASRLGKITGRTYP